LRKISHGETISYDELARRVGQKTAQRAVARANGMNCVAILIPCHRVIGKDGSLTGYGGGLWRKRLLLELERTGRLPGSDGRRENRESEGAGNGMEGVGRAQDRLEACRTNGRILAGRPSEARGLDATLSG